MYEIYKYVVFWTVRVFTRFTRFNKPNIKILFLNLFVSVNEYSASHDRIE